ncbi:hypothetical protein LTR27_012186 [Elasticomyces elasticus]|nr:hypothetical protein LTR27_012186 [Elasticomyces elasticus]
MSTGVLVIANYAPLLYQSLGLSNSNSLILGASLTTVGMLSNALGATISDRFGRRRLLLFGFASTLVMLSLATGLMAWYTRTGSKGSAAGAVTALFLYGICYGALVDVNVWTVVGELFPSHLRSLGTGVGVSTLMLSALLWVAIAPVASATIGWKYYLVFICLTAAHMVHIWFQLPENELHLKLNADNATPKTSGLALEEMESLFGDLPADQTGLASLRVHDAGTVGATNKIEAEKIEEA